jgi:hypothetical protein
MRNLLTLIASLGLVGCVGGIDTPPVGGNTDDPNPNGTGGGGTGQAAEQAKRAFEQDVFPVVQRMCAGCHTDGAPQGNITGFVGASLQTAYATAVSYGALVGDFTTAAPILERIEGNAKTAAHQPLDYTDAEVNSITAWLTLELDARGAGTGGGTGGAENAAQVSARLLDEWTGCMELARFETADMRQVGNTGSDEGNCQQCHVLGEQQFVASNQSNPYFFPYVTEDKYYLLQYFAVDFSQGLPNAKIVINERAFIGVAERLPPHQAHPEFNAQDIIGPNAPLTNFYNTTMQAKLAAPQGICGPSKLLN